jgi:hypothetical protein
MEEQAPKWHRWLAWLGLACALAVLAEWGWHLAASMPAISRSDHLLAIWRIAPAIEKGNWSAVAAWVFEFTGGHVIGYMRALQLVNYLAFDYSGAFIKVAAIACYAATWAAVAFAVLRTLGLGPAAGLVLPWAAWLLCSPVLSNLVTWPEGTLPFLAPTLVATLLVPWLATGGTRAVVFGTLATALTNGSGFVFLPAALAVLLRRGQVVALAATASLAIAGLATLMWALRTRVIPFEGTLPYAMDLGIVVESLTRLFTHPAFFAQYYLAVLALPFAPFRVVDSWPLGLAIAAYTVFLLSRFDHRAPGPARGWLMLAYFGLFAAAALGLGRFGYVDPAGLADVTVTSHYATVVFPLFIALGPLTALALRTVKVWQRWLLAAAVVSLAGTMGWKRSQVERDFTAVARTELAAQFGVQNWNIYSSAVTLGDTSVGQVGMLRVFPDLKALGKYPEVSSRLVLDPASIGLREARRVDQGSCGRVYSLAADTRYSWWRQLPEWTHLYMPAQVPVTRAVGFTDCDAEFVVMLGGDGAPLCVARPGPLATYFTEAELKSRPGMGAKSFDFSCPALGTGSVWAFDPRQKTLTPLKLEP